MNKQLWAAIAGVPVILAIIYGVWKFDDRYMLTRVAEAANSKIAAKLTLVEQRLDQKIAQDDLRYTRRNLYEIRRDHMDVEGEWLPETPEKIREMYEQFTNDEEDLEEQLSE